MQDCARTYLIDSQGGCVYFDNPVYAQQCLDSDTGWRVVDRETYERTRAAQYASVVNPLIEVEAEHARW